MQNNNKIFSDLSKLAGSAVGGDGYEARDGVDGGCPC